MKHFLLPFLLLLTISCIAQTDTYKVVTVGDGPTLPLVSDSIILQFLSRNLCYPEAQLDTTNNKVVIRFAINELGLVEDVRIVKSGGLAFDNEVRRVMALIPRMQPAMYDGKPFKLMFTLPFTFKR